MRVRWIVAAVVFVLIIAGCAFLLRLERGFSSRETPTVLDEAIARMIRRAVVPRNARAATNPIQFSSDVWAESRAHFADHCASCHANDGSGQTELGQNLYPRAPDMRLADTQRLTDGELYWIIENGIRLTGMPAWGTGRADDEDTWKLVHFIRRLDQLTPAQLKEMEALNPKSPGELEEEHADEDFLSGRDAPAPHVHEH